MGHLVSSATKRDYVLAGGLTSIAAATDLPSLRCLHVWSGQR